MFKDSVHGVKCINAIVAIAYCSQVRPAVAINSGPKESICSVVACCHVFDDDTFGPNDTNSVIKAVVAFEDDLVAIDATNDYVVGLDGDCFGVGSFVNQHQIACNCCINCFLDGLKVLRDSFYVCIRGRRAPTRSKNSHECSRCNENA